LRSESSWGEALKLAAGVEWILSEELMSYFQSLLRRLRPRRQPSNVMIDCLESRQLLSASPTVSNVYLTGSATVCTGIVVQFDEPVDPAHAQDMQAYGAGKLPPTVKSSNFDWTQLLGFLAQPKLYLVTNVRLRP
jgi:hypothetical protein